MVNDEHYPVALFRYIVKQGIEFIDSLGVKSGSNLV